MTFLAPDLLFGIYKENPQPRPLTQPYSLKAVYDENASWEPGVIRAVGFDTSAFGGHGVILGHRFLAHHGQDQSTVGIGLGVCNLNQHVQHGGSDYLRTGADHDIQLSQRVVRAAGSSAQSFGLQWLSHYLRHITAAGGSNTLSLGAAWVSHSPRHIAPVQIWPPSIQENHVVGGTQFIGGLGTDMQAFGTRIIPESQTAYPSGFVGNSGQPDVMLHTRYVLPPGWQATPDDLRFVRQHIWNLRQIIEQEYDPGDGLSFGRWTGIENRNKELRPGGWRSDRSGYTSIENNARLVEPGGIADLDPESHYKAGSVTHRHRPLALDGVEPPLLSNWATVFNNARLLGAVGRGSQELGVPGLENRSRQYKGVGNFDNLATGTPMVSDSVRNIRFESRYSIEPPQIELPDVRLHTRYIEDVSAGDELGCGVGALEIRWTIIAPSWAMHPPAFVGEPSLRNVTPEVRQWGANQEEFGIISIRTQWREVVTGESYMTQFGRAIVRDRRHWVELVTLGPPPALLPGPVVTKQGGLPEAQIAQPLGIGLLADQVPRPTMGLLLAYPSGFDSMRMGEPSALANSIRVEPGIGELLVGEPFVGLKKRVLSLANNGIASMAAVGRPNSSPHTIYAVLEAPAQAMANHGGGELHAVDHSPSGRWLCGPGSPTLTLRHRAIAPTGITGSEVSWAHAANRNATIAVDGLNHLRFGVPQIPGDQFIEEHGSPSMMLFGRTTVSRPPYTGALYITAAGVAPPVGTGTLIEHFNRTYTLNGWDSSRLGASVQGDTPYQWQGLRVGPLVPTIPAGFNAEQFGVSWVSLKVRDVAAEGFDAFACEEDYQAFHFRMRIFNVSTSVPERRWLGAIGHVSSAFGIPGIRNRTHHIRPDGNAEQYRKGAPTT